MQCDSDHWQQEHEREPENKGEILNYINNILPIERSQ